jgi:hypothetical protein
VKGRKSKERDLEERLVVSEYPHAFRRKWPAKKARANREVRHVVRQVLNSPGGLPAPEAAENSGSLRRREVKKWPGSSVTRRELVSGKERRRLRRVGWNYFKEPYRSRNHRERFVEFLRDIVADRSPDVATRAAVVADWMNPAAPPLGVATIAKWLERFFRDEPSWRSRLVEWVERSSMPKLANQGVAADETLPRSARSGRRR